MVNNKLKYLVLSFWYDKFAV